MNAKQLTQIKQDNIRYRKVGRRYIPVNDPAPYDGLTEGWWLVKVSPGSTTIRSIVYPDKAELHAAIRDKADKIMDIIRKASEAKPRAIAMTPGAAKDWNDFIFRHGQEFSTLQFPSYAQNAELILEALTNEKL